MSRCEYMLTVNSRFGTNGCHFKPLFRQTEANAEQAVFCNPIKDIA